MKNEKFVPKKKMSKKSQKAENAKKRCSWAFCPITRIVPSRKRYDRNRIKRELDGSDS
jgi:hypothetical protein